MGERGGRESSVSTGDCGEGASEGEATGERGDREASVSTGDCGEGASEGEATSS
jgi:hypothetical protein